MLRRVTVMTSVKLLVQLKFPEQVKKTKANGFPTIPVEVSSASDLWNIDDIRRQICANDSFKGELRAKGIDASSIDHDNSHFLCRGVVLSDDNLNTGVWIVRPEDEGEARRGAAVAVGTAGAADGGMECYASFDALAGSRLDDLDGDHPPPLSVTGVCLNRLNPCAHAQHMKAGPRTGYGVTTLQLSQNHHK